MAAWSATVNHLRTELGSPTWHGRSSAAGISPTILRRQGRCRSGPARQRRNDLLLYPPSRRRQPHAAAAPAPLPRGPRPRRRLPARLGCGPGRTTRHIPCSMRSPIRNLPPAPPPADRLTHASANGQRRSCSRSSAAMPANTACRPARSRTSTEPASESSVRRSGLPTRPRANRSPSAGDRARRISWVPSYPL